MGGKISDTPVTQYINSPEKRFTVSSTFLFEFENYFFYYFKSFSLQIILMSLTDSSIHSQFFIILASRVVGT